MKTDLDHATMHVKCTQCGTEIVRIRNIFAQAALTGYEKARQELEKMEAEYKALADSLERHEQEAAIPSKEQGPSACLEML
jgi:hypothetical protein